MSTTIENLAALLARGGIRHHLDVLDDSIRVVFVTRRYLSRRAERLAILRLEAIEGEGVCRVSLERAFAAGPEVAATCLTLCQALEGVPLVRVEHDAEADSLRLVAEFPLEDGEPTPRQLFALLDAVVAGAEAGQTAIAAGGRDAAAPREAA